MGDLAFVAANGLYEFLAAYTREFFAETCSAL
jgi:hypothetical protein